MAAGSGGAGGGKFGSSTTEDSPTGKPPLLGMFFHGKPIGWNQGLQVMLSSMADQ